MDYVSHVLPALGEDERRPASGQRARRGNRGDEVDPAEVLRAQGRSASGRGRAPGGGAPLAGPAAGARRPVRGLLRRRRGRRGGGAPRGDTRRARRLGGGARAVSNERPSPLLRGLRRTGSAVSRCVRSTRSSGACAEEACSRGSSMPCGPRPGRSRSFASCLLRASGLQRPQTAYSTKPSSGSSGVRREVGATPTSRSSTRRGHCFSPSRATAT